MTMKRRLKDSSPEKGRIFVKEVSEGLSIMIFSSLQMDKNGIRFTELVLTINTLTLKYLDRINSWVVETC
jgi:hypothetical protein